MNDTTVTRFPLERRREPIMHTLYQAAPDARHVGNIIEAMRWKPIGDPRATADEAAASVIAKTMWPEAIDQRNAALDAMLRTYVDKALTSCNLAKEADQESGEAIDAAREARYGAGSSDADALEMKASTIIYKAAWLQVQAFIQTEAAQGVARAVDLAKRGETWSPRSVHEETCWLCNAQKQFLKH